MEIIQEAITGSENLKDKKTPLGALIEFYQAFNQRNMKLMAQNWANTEEIAMDNPLGGIMRGWKQIQKVYQRIFEGQAQVYVEFYEYTLHETDGMFYAVGRERGHFKVGERQIDLAIRTSRIYQKIQGQWRQVHHHGSMDQPELLRTYQDLVRS